MSLTTTRLALATAASTLAFWGMPAAAQNSATYVDIRGEVGYATNPFLDFNGDGSGFGRLSAYALHRRTGERSLTELTAYVENSTYLQDYGSKQIFDLNAYTQQQVSEQARIFLSAGFSGDVAGQLSNRFVTVPQAPIVPDQPAPPPDVVVDPDLSSFTSRQFRARGNVGAAIQASERSTVTVSAGVQRIFFNDDFLEDYTLYSADAAYDRKLSERSTIGGRLSVWRTDYDGGDDRTTVVNPQLTYRSRLSESLDVSGAIGLTLAHQDGAGGSGWSTNLSLEAALCRTSESERLCGRLSRYGNTSGAGGLVTTTSVGVDWFKRIDDAQTVQVSASLVRYAGDDDVPTVRSDALHYRISGNYDRKLGRRASIGANAGIRNLRLDGPDPDIDASASVYVRYRLGDIQ